MLYKELKLDKSLIKIENYNINISIIIYKRLKRSVWKSII